MLHSTRKMVNLTFCKERLMAIFDASCLLRQWNSSKGNEQRKMDEFLESKNTREFIDALLEEDRLNGV